MPGYLSFKWSRWVILSASIGIVGCTPGFSNLPEEERKAQVKVIFEKLFNQGAQNQTNAAQNQTNVAQITNTMSGAVQTMQPQATIEVSSCGQTTPPSLLPH